MGLIIAEDLGCGGWEGALWGEMRGGEAMTLKIRYGGAFGAPNRVGSEPQSRRIVGRPG